MHESRKMTPLSSITSTRQGASPWRSPEYYRDLDENHVPLPTVASDIWAFACVIVNVGAQLSKGIALLMPTFRFRRRLQNKRHFFHMMTP